MSGFIPISEVLEQAEQEAVEWLADRLPRGGGDEGGYRCPECGRISPSEGHLSRHRVKAHGWRRPR